MAGNANDMLLSAVQKKALYIRYVSWFGSIQRTRAIFPGNHAFLLISAR